MLIDDQTGYVIYTHNKGMDFGIDLNQPRYANTVIRKVFERARTLEKGSSTMTDFIPYLAAGMEPRLFFAAPVFMGDERIAIMVFTIDTQKLNRFMTHEGNWEQSGFDQTGESYLVGEDGLMRTSSCFFLQDREHFLKRIRPLVGDTVIDRLETTHTTILTLPIRTDAATHALRDHWDTTLVDTDYRGEKVLTSYTPLNIKGMNWAVISQTDYDEAFAPLRQHTLRMLLILAAVVLIVAFFAFWNANRFLRPINVLMRGTRELKKDNLEVQLEPVTEDEMKTLTEMFNREELQRLYDQVSEKQREIMDSIRYALRIQHAALPEGKPLQEAFRDSFVLYRPRDIVSGDRKERNS